MYQGVEEYKQSYLVEARWKVTSKRDACGWLSLAQKQETLIGFGLCFITVFTTESRRHSIDSVLSHSFHKTKSQ